MSDLHERAKQVFLDALGYAGASRDAFVADVCGDDTDLRNEVESLLAYHDESHAASLDVSPEAPGERFAPGDVFADRYRMVTRLGLGGMGEVWRADDLVLNIPVALKLIHSNNREAITAALNEVRLARQITHPAVCRVFDVGEANDQVFYSMEFVRGEDLAALLKRVGRLPSEKVVEIARQLCAGLAAAHARGVLHRDLKPANVLMDEDGLVRITDFGIATTKQNGMGHHTLIGTPGYMAPEQRAAGAPLSERTDIFALGLVLYELLVGRRPFVPSAANGEPPRPSTLVADVDPTLEQVILEALSPDPERRPPSATVMGAALSAVATGEAGCHENSIAVLPFADMSEGKDQAFFCEGMSEEIINALGRVADLRVASSTSSFRFRSRGADTREIGRELTVSWLLEGSVRRSGSAVRISVQLVRARDGFSAWSDRFDRTLDDIFATQDEIAAAIVRILSAKVVASGPLVTSTTSNALAYSLYLEGRYLWNKRPGDVVWQALERFEHAIALDPKFAPAHAALAGVYGTLGAWEFGVLPPAEALAKAKAAATRALELDPLLAAGHTAIGYTTLHFDWNADAACRELDQAIALNPAWVDAHHWHSHALCAAGRFPESLAACRQTLELDPLNPLMHAHLAWHHYMARDYAQALAQAEHVVRMEPSFHWGHFFAGWALERLGRGAEAVRALEQAARCSSDSPVMVAGLGHAFAALQERSKALRVAQDLQRLRAGKGLFAYELAAIYAALGDHDQAFEWLTHAVEERSGWIAYLRVDPRLDALHADPRFHRLYRDGTN